MHNLWLDKAGLEAYKAKQDAEQAKVYEWPFPVVIGQIPKDDYDIQQ